MAGSVEKENKDFIQRIVSFRESKGYSQDAFAKDFLGLKSSSKLKKWESGISLPKIDDLRLLAEKTGMCFDYLLSGTETKNVKFNRETGLSNAAINNLRLLKGCLHFRCIDYMLRDFDDALNGSRIIQKMIEEKKKLLISDGGSSIESAAFMGLKWQMTEEYGRLLDRYTTAVARAELEADGKTVAKNGNRWWRIEYDPTGEDDYNPTFFDPCYETEESEEKQ